jgi:hypothetical protein
MKQFKKLGISKKELVEYYSELRNCKDIIRKIYEIQAKVPRSRYGGYPNPEIFYILMRKVNNIFALIRKNKDCCRNWCKLWHNFFFHPSSYGR